MTGSRASKNRAARAGTKHNNNALKPFKGVRMMTSAKPMQQSQPASNADPRWTAIATRDTRSDGEFFYSVRTTGVYCRPSCAARPARRENVAFHTTAEEAERAGFRPCKRCKPDRNSRADAALPVAIVKSSLGYILVARSAKGVCAILLGDSPAPLERDLRQRFAHVRLLGSDADTESLAAQVARVIENPRLGLDVPLDVRGTAFQQRVWRALRAIPAGSTVSYAEVAQRIGAPRSMRAVAQACAANPLAVLIPCHRVVRHDGALSGYRWGIERKRALLTLESGR
jgi:AraC family transcriptional regulator of adaptative response/methylated-DNA-[protein]-cysteine methyltransferase